MNPVSEEDPSRSSLLTGIGTSQPSHRLGEDEVPTPDQDTASTAALEVVRALRSSFLAPLQEAIRRVKQIAMLLQKPPRGRPQARQVVRPQDLLEKRIEVLDLIYFLN